MAKYIRQTSPYNTQIVALGIDTYLKMLLHDNFVVSFTTRTHTVTAQSLWGCAMSTYTIKAHGRGVLAEDLPRSSQHMMQRHLSYLACCPLQCLCCAAH